MEQSLNKPGKADVDEAEEDRSYENRDENNVGPLHRLLSGGKGDTLRLDIDFLEVFLDLVKRFFHIHGFSVTSRPGGIRTPNTRIWSPVLYPLELLA